MFIKSYKISIAFFSENEQCINLELKNDQYRIYTLPCSGYNSTAQDFDCRAQYGHSGDAHIYRKYVGMIRVHVVNLNIQFTL